MPRTTYPPAKNTGSKESLALCSEWLKSCVNHHSACERLRPASLQDWSPTRLVFVGTQDDPALRLCEGSAIHHQVRYLTLSHCWGPRPHRKVLTQRKLASWIREIPRGEIMRTFRDAIDVTRVLGVQYLWIDSLCIIQDSESDWLSESKFMSDVYRFSCCNIAAAHASSDAMGIFMTRKPPKLEEEAASTKPFDWSAIDAKFLNFLNKPADDHHKSGERFEGPYEELEYEMAWQALRESPLYKRAWVVQEVSPTKSQILLWVLKQNHSVFCHRVYCILQAINCSGNVMSFAPVNFSQAKCRVTFGHSVVCRIAKYLTSIDRIHR